MLCNIQQPSVQTPSSSHQDVPHANCAQHNRGGMRLECAWHALGYCKGTEQEMVVFWTGEPGDSKVCSAAVSKVHGTYGMINHRTLSLLQQPAQVPHQLALARHGLQHARRRLCNALLRGLPHHAHTTMHKVHHHRCRNMLPVCAHPRHTGCQASRPPWRSGLSSENC